MSIANSFNIGITGINSSSGSMNVIADNIANAGTLGFKSSRAEFQDMLSMSLRGIDGGDQFGTGTKISAVKPIFTQGAVVRTENATDLAINGQGFFTLSTPFGRGYSRDGSFHLDKEGSLINNDGYKVLGYAANEDGEITNSVQELKLGKFFLPAKGTEKVSVNMNLDSREIKKDFNIAKVDETSSFSTGVVVYDNVGTQRLINIYFSKSDNNKWKYNVVVDPEDAAGDAKTPQVMASGQLIFSDKGVLQEEIQEQNSFNFNKGATPNQKIDFDFGMSIKEDGQGTNASTQFGSNSSVSRYTQNGSSAANLTSISFNDNGVLTAVYSNGDAKDLFQIGVSRFENNEGLFKLGKNLFKETRKSGQGAIGKPNEGGRGEVLSRSVEQSNVDIGKEFVNLMTTQRNFSANTKTITTADQMLQDVLNLKR